MRGFDWEAFRSHARRGSVDEIIHMVKQYPTHESRDRGSWKVSILGYMLDINISEEDMHRCCSALLRIDPTLADDFTEWNEDDDAYESTVLMDLVESRVSNETFALVAAHVPKAHFLLQNEQTGTCCSRIVHDYIRCCIDVSRALFRLKTVIHYGADPAQVYYGGDDNLLVKDVLRCHYQGRDEVADLLLENGAPFVGEITSYPLIQKRHHCKRACRALMYALSKRKDIVQKDVVRFLLVPMVWETRLNEAWLL